MDTLITCIDTLRACLPVIVVLLIVFSPPLFHAILAAGEGVARLWGNVRGAGAAPVPASSF
jgi:hypothetical protein